MPKDASLRIRIDRDVKEKSEKRENSKDFQCNLRLIFFLNQVILTGGNSSDITLPQAPTHLNWDQMTQVECR